MIESRDDFVDIIGSLTNFVQNERVAAYNEAVDMMLGSVREWMRAQGIRPDSEHLPELLDKIKANLANAPTDERN